MPGVASTAFRAYLVFVNLRPAITARASSLRPTGNSLTASGLCYSAFQAPFKRSRLKRFETVWTYCYGVVHVAAGGLVLRSILQVTDPGTFGLGAFTIACAGTDCVLSPPEFTALTT